MTRATSRPAGMARRARIAVAANAPMRLILGLPFRTPLSGALMLLTLRGRKTGRRYRQPVSYVRDGDVLLTPGGGRWKLNLRSGEPITARLEGRDVRLVPELVRDIDEVDPLVRRMIEKNPRAAGFMPFVAPGGEIDRAKLELGLRYGFAVVRWHFAR